jgi:soluble lytic murein transglycosylase
MVNPRGRRYTAPVVRFATLALLATAGVCLASPAAALPAGAEGLGVAYRALQAGEYERAYRVASALDTDGLLNADYAHYAAGQAAYLTGRHDAALARFQTLAADGNSRFQAIARWRVADTHWQLGDHEEARRRYEQLLRRHASDGDGGAAVYRIAEAHRRAGRSAEAIAAYRRLRIEFPQHPLEARATERLFELGGEAATSLTPAQRLRRTVVLGDDHRWQDAHREVWSIGEIGSPSVDAERHFWTAMTLYRQRRQYERAGEILLAHYETMGDRAAYAIFHGARALSRAHRDEESIRWYLRVVAEYPRSSWAPQAQFLAGWLHYNMGNYREAIPLLQQVRARFPRSRWVQGSRWFLGFSLFLVGDHDAALPIFEAISGGAGATEAGQGHYWMARTLQELERTPEAVAAYRELVGRFPFSWYALLARARLAELGVRVGPFGDAPRAPGDAPALTSPPPRALGGDPLIRRANELLSAGLGVEAGHELRRGERGLLRRHSRPDALAMLLDRYRAFGNYHRPWSLAVTYGGNPALSAPARGRARIWWEHAYPLAYDDVVEPWRERRGLPKYYVHAIMRKESGFDPHALSFADARGLVQMIPRTTRRIAEQLGIDYTDDMLWDPDMNLRIGTWYLSGLLEKFRHQIPLAAGSFNSGPAPVMRWLDQNGERPIDEFVELVSFAQTREYMKLVTGIYARYVYLYGGELYEQPLAVDRRYVEDDLTY